MKNINERIQFLVNEYYKGNVSEFERICGLKKNTLKHVLGGRFSKPSFETIEAIIRANEDISPLWLLTGVGEIEVRKPTHSNVFTASDIRGAGIVAVGPNNHFKHTKTVINDLDSVNALLTKTEEENLRLSKEIERLNVENELLKKLLLDKEEIIDLLKQKTNH